MANELTSNELARLYELHDAGSTQKEIANTICGQFGRQTLDRTTIFRRLKLRGTMGLLDSWKVWLNEHEGDAEKAIDVSQLAEDDCALFMWAVMLQLRRSRK